MVQRLIFLFTKIEHYHEARWWNKYLNLQKTEVPVGTFKATVLIETITASFQLDEIIFELKDHIVGLNCGRWDYISLTSRNLEIIPIL
jgi:malate synthase